MSADSRRRWMPAVAAIARALLVLGILLYVLDAFRRRRAPQPAPPVHPVPEESPLDVVEVASWESFPASDAPGWIGASVLTRL